MQEQALYEDSEIRITSAEIRCQERTIRTASVTSVSVESERPWKWLWVRFLPVTPERIDFINTPSWRKWQTQRSQKPWPQGMPVRPGPRGPIQSRRNIVKKHKQDQQPCFRGHE